MYNLELIHILDLLTLQPGGFGYYIIIILQNTTHIYVMSIYLYLYKKRSLKIEEETAKVQGKLNQKFKYFLVPKIIEVHIVFSHNTYSLFLK